MKKITAVLLSVLVVLCFASCANQTDNTPQASELSTQESGEGSATQADSEAEAPTQDAAEQQQSDSTKTLVVYYSASGNTQRIAEYIASATSGELFELVPVNPYSSDDLNWRDENSRVVYEHNNQSARNVELTANTVDNWDSYDTVFIGYPIWWGIAAWPVDSFISANDFSGKTVIPFCTSSSSGLGESGSLLAQAAGSGNWQEGVRFTSNDSEESVLQWLEGIEY